MAKKKQENEKESVSKRELEELRNQLARALADYDNLTKRVDKQKEDFKRLANLELVTSILPAIDMLEDAQEHLKESGLALTIKELEEALEAHGIERIDASPGEKFDEEVHEVVEITSDSERENGEIVEELLAGWKFSDGPVIRASKVLVKREEK